ncbi:unnamed protein product [Arctogadus glacialis]
MFFTLFSKAWKKAASVKTAQAGFRGTGTDEDTVTFVQWRVAHNDTFCGGRTTNAVGYKRGLMGRLTIAFQKKRRGNLKQKYKDLKNPPTGVSTEGGQTTAASWKWFELMHEAIGDRPSVTPPVLIATCAQGAVVFTAPSTSTPGGRQVEAAEETALGSLTPTTTGTSTASTPKKQRVDVVEVLNELKSQDEQEWRTMQSEEREREERREAGQPSLDERRDQEAAARDERRDQEAAARDEHFLAILERLAPK